MNETKPSSVLEPRRKPSPTPPPASIEFAEISSQESSSDDVLRELLDAERQAEAWIALEPRHLLRASDFRQIEEAGISMETVGDPSLSEERYERIWPLPALIVNGVVIRCPHWTLEELLIEIGADVRQPPTVRKWQQGQIVKSQVS